MNEKRMREDIIRLLKVANIREVSAIWNFAKELIPSERREAQHGQAD